MSMPKAKYIIYYYYSLYAELYPCRVKGSSWRLFSFTDREYKSRTTFFPWPLTVKGRNSKKQQQYRKFFFLEAHSFHKTVDNTVHNLFINFI